MANYIITDAQFDNGTYDLDNREELECKLEILYKSDYDDLSVAEQLKVDLLCDDIKHMSEDKLINELEGYEYIVKKDITNYYYII